MFEEYRDILHRCYRCGNCKAPQDSPEFSCPAFNKNRMESNSPGGRLWLLRGLLNNELEITPSLSDLFFSCTMCMNCTRACSFEFSNDLTNIMMAANNYLVEQKIPAIPSSVQTYFENIYSHGNPWKKKPKDRDSWAAGLDIPPYTEADEYLLYVGDLGSYEPRSMKVARALGEILLKAGISFGILGAKEITDGNDSRLMGETSLFQYLAEKNIELFNKRKVRKVITLSPHAYNVFKNEYPKLGASFESFHYTRILKEIMDRGILKFLKPVERKVTYHDPCFLGKWNSEYHVPREILQGIPGIELLEMDSIKENSFCCGGGGGNVFTDILGGGENAPPRVRLGQAKATGAEILAVGCPGCMVMFEDALETIEKENKLEVLDISEILLKSIG